MKIMNVRTTDDYRLLIDFGEGNQVSFNMRRMVETLPYLRLKDPEVFKSVKFEDKAVYWDPPDEKPEIFPMRITVDEILFALR
ncbi:MAG: DUF2442 domain-containing protein [Syntrophomonadaceae bacterium]|nr:DUF2442 domain-containing protein [Syntrophomonadaceae bacterium]